MKLSILSVCDAVTRWALYAALFLTPIFFLPFTLYPVDLGKQLIFISLMLVAAIAWLVKAVRVGKLEYAKSFANIPLTALVAFVIISAFFSGARHISFMGQSGGEVDTAIAVIGFALLYFLTSVTFKEKESGKNALVALVAGAFLVMAMAVPAVIQSLAQFVGYPFALWNGADIGAFNTVGTVNAVSLYAGLMAVFAFSVAEHAPGDSRLRTGCLALAILCLITAFFTGYWVTFVALAIAFGLYAALCARSESAKVPYRNAVPLTVIVISLCLLVLGSGIVSIPLPHIATPPEVVPSISASFIIAQGTARAGMKDFLLGSGPATYQYEYGKYHDVSLNQTIFWNVQFTQGFNAILTHLVSWGVIGTIIFLLFLWAITVMLVRLAANRSSDHLVRGITAASAYMALALVLYPQNFTLYVFLFALAGMVTAAYAVETGKYRTISLASSPYGAFAWPLGILLLAMAFVALLYVFGRRYVAAVQFARGIRVAAATKKIETALPLLVSGVMLDPENDAQLTALASAYLTEANDLAGTTAQSDVALQKKITDIVASAVFAAERATQVNPENAQNWIALARVYEAVVPFNANAGASAFMAYGKAAALQPNDPAIPTYLGNAHATTALRMKTGNAVEYAAALLNFEKALALKADYTPAYFALIQMFAREGRVDDAVLRAERLRVILSNDEGTLLELGILHYNAGRMDKAQVVLEQAVRLTPDYANALYFLGLVYEKQGDRVRALAQFEHVLRLNPKSAEMTAIVNNVRAGKPALTVGSPPTPLEKKK